jgi:uncharacterized membrane protein
VPDGARLLDRGVAARHDRLPSREERIVVIRIEIDRSPEDVFAYLDQLDRHSEWQADLERARSDTEGPTRVGSRAIETRRVPGGPRDFTYEITEHDPPRHVAWQGVDGPVRPVGAVTIEPLDGGSRSRVTTELDLRGHGLGKLIAPMARRGARRSLPEDYERLKQRLEVDVRAS